MNMIKLVGLLAAVMSMSSCGEEENRGPIIIPSGGVTVLQPKTVTKSNTKPVYMHYMPWFDSPEYGGSWGIHWTMSTRNPDVIEDGQRQIAAHYYPLIGPYDSEDPLVIDYHMLLMKYAGVDGVLINWYGEEGTNNDIDALLKNSNAIIDRTDDTGMEFAVVLEDRFAGSIEDTKANIKYLEDNYYGNKQYISFDNRPLTLLFGPITFFGADKWTEILNVSGANEVFMPLWHTTSSVGADNATGEFAWVYRNGSSGLASFYSARTAASFVGGGAYAGFKDYYAQGGWGDEIGWELEVSAARMKETLDLAASNDDKLDFVQLITWNDFGEGTMIEPTVEFGFQFLEEVQDYTGVPYGLEELTLVYDWYTMSASESNDDELDEKLEQMFYYLVALQIDDAKSLMEEIN